MSINSVGSQSTSLLQLMKDKRSAMRSMVSALEAGDMTAARASATTFQNDQSKIDAIVGSGAPPASGLRSVLKTDLSNLLAAVQSGDPTQATAALAQFRADRPMGPSPLPHDGREGATATSSKSLVGDLRNMLKAIASGDATGATSYAAALQTDLDTVLNNGTGTPSTTTSSPAPASGPANSGGSFLDDLTALINAVQSGGAPGAEAAAGTLATDAISGPGGARRGHYGAASVQTSDASTPSLLSLLNSAAASTRS